jgi:hypothetical protein
MPTTRRHSARIACCCRCRCRRCRSPRPGWSRQRLRWCRSSGPTWKGRPSRPACQPRGRGPACQPRRSGSMWAAPENRVTAMITLMAAMPAAVAMITGRRRTVGPRRRIAGPAPSPAPVRPAAEFASRGVAVVTVGPRPRPVGSCPRPVGRVRGGRTGPWRVDLDRRVTGRGGGAAAVVRSQAERLPQRVGEVPAGPVPTLRGLGHPLASTASAASGRPGHQRACPEPGQRRGILAERPPGFRYACQIAPVVSRSATSSKPRAVSTSRVCAPGRAIRPGGSAPIGAPPGTGEKRGAGAG